MNRIINWLYVCCFMVFAMAVIGAITRLTESGLSITEWKPIAGALPPLNETAWQEQFALYQQSPEFATKHNWMQIEDFKKIFFWEWLHRLWGRMIGVVFAIPYFYFLIQRKIPEGFKVRLFGIFLLGGLQGVVGWWMVASGLIDRPSVSHFRLATHLVLALTIFAAMWWTILDLKKSQNPPPSQPVKSGHAIATLVLLAITITWGAFTAGLDAGLMYNTFPMMDGSLTPSGHPDILHDHGWVQFAHRWLAVTTGLMALALAARRKNAALAFMVFVQIGLGIATLLSQVNIALAALHQAGAIILLMVLLKEVHCGLSAKPA